MSRHLRSTIEEGSRGRDGGRIRLVVRECWAGGRELGSTRTTCGFLLRASRRIWLVYAVSRGGGNALAMPRHRRSWRRSVRACVSVRVACSPFAFRRGSLAVDGGKAHMRRERLGTSCVIVLATVARGVACLLWIASWAGCGWGSGSNPGEANDSPRHAPPRYPGPEGSRTVALCMECHDGHRPAPELKRASATLTRTAVGTAVRSERRPGVNYVGIDWAYGRAAWCALGEAGAIEAEGLIPADEVGLARLVLRLGAEVKACVEMMSGAIWVKTSSSSPAGRSRSPTRARSGTSRRLPARPTRSMRGCSPSSADAS